MPTTKTVTTYTSAEQAEIALNNYHLSVNNVERWKAEARAAEDIELQAKLMGLDYSTGRWLSEYFIYTASDLSKRIRALTSEKVGYSVTHAPREFAAVRELYECLERLEALEEE